MLCKHSSRTAILCAHRARPHRKWMSVAATAARPVRSGTSICVVLPMSLARPTYCAGVTMQTVRPCFACLVYHDSPAAI